MSDTRHRLDDDSAAEAARKPLLLKRGLLIYLFIILLAGWSFGLWRINADRALTLESSDNQLILSATGFANHVTAMIHDGVGAAIAGANEVRAADTAHPLTDAQIAAVLSNMLAGGEYVRTLFIATPTRFVAAQRSAQANSYQSTFVADLLASTDSAWVGQPLNVEQGDANVLIPIANRVDDINGEPTWAGALLSFTSLDALYRTLPVEFSGLALSHSAGTLLVRVPTLPGYKFSGADMSGFLSTREYLRQPTKPLVTYVAPDPFSGNARQFAVRRIEGYPLRATASRDVENSLIDWRLRARNSLVILSISSLALAGLTIALFILLQRRYEALRRSEERFQVAIAGSNDGIWDWEVKSNHVYYSPRLKEHLGVGRHDDFPPHPDSFWQRMHPDDIELSKTAVQRHLSQREPYDIEYRMLTGNGEHKWFRARAQASWDDSGAPLRMSGSISDIHQRKLAEQSLHQAQERELHAREEFAQHLILAQEHERQRLANELHDSVGQNLSLIKNRALMALQDANLPTAAAHHVMSLSELATDVIAEVRVVAQNLRPLHIEQLGLTDALETLLNKVSESSGLIIERRLENVDDVIIGTAATHMFRIVQEAFNNILKHAHAQYCKVVLERDLHCVRLNIIDDGRGFDPLADTTTHGLGLASIAERVRMLSAKWHINSKVGGGTIIAIEIPITESLLNDTQTDL